MRAYRIVDGKYCVTGSSIRFQENANRKVVDYKIIEFEGRYHYLLMVLMKIIRYRIYSSLALRK